MAKEEDSDVEDAKICALCKWNKDVSGEFYCGHPRQSNTKLKEGTEYNDTCKLFEEREERKRMYDWWDQEIK